MNGFTHRCLWAVCLATSPVTGFADEPPDLRHNPFSRPQALVNGGDDAFAITSNDGRLTFDLLATMVGSRQRLANVGGRILEIGDEIQGYTLESIFEDRAVFVKAGEKLIVHVRAKPEPNDE